jgi:hypothetical protein
MSRTISSKHLQGKERQEIIEAVQQQAKAAALQAITPVLTGLLEADVALTLGRETGAPRQISSQKREIDWTCGYGGCQDAHHLTREGHDQRDLEKQVQDMPVPMLECQQCPHDGICQCSILEKEQRFWLDGDQDVLFSSGLGQSVCAISQAWSAKRDGRVGRRTLNERIHQIEPLVHLMHGQPITSVPAVVRLDGIWVTIQKQGEQSKQEKRKRSRKQRTGHKMVILVAPGFWEDGTREILDWQRASSEEHTQWERVLKRLGKRGVPPETGRTRGVPDSSGGEERPWR